jgi:hypothetical protein
MSLPIKNQGRCFLQQLHKDIDMEKLEISEGRFGYSVEQLEDWVYQAGFKITHRPKKNKWRDVLKRLLSETSAPVTDEEPGTSVAAAAAAAVTKVATAVAIVKEERLQSRAEREAQGRASLAVGDIIDYSGGGLWYQVIKLNPKRVCIRRLQGGTHPLEKDVFAKESRLINVCYYPFKKYEYAWLSFK